MARRANLTAVIGLDSRRFRRGIMRAVRFTQSIGRKLRNALRIDMRSLVTTGAIGMAIAQPLRKAFDFERIRVQFGILLGDMERGAARFARVRDMSAVTPFQIEELANASKQLEIMGLRGEENIKFLTLVGDAAAAMNPEMIQQVAFWMGRLNVEAQNKAVGRSTLRMLQLGVVSADTKLILENMANSGATLGDMLMVVENELRRFEGGMNLLSKTGWGLFSTMRDVWNIALAEFGEAMSQDAKGAMVEVIDTMREMWRDGVIKKWAERASNAVMILAGTIIAAMKGVKEAQAGLGLLFKEIGMVAIKGLFKGLMTIVKVLGPLIGNAIKAGLLDAVAEVVPAVRQKADAARKELDMRMASISATVGIDDGGFLDGVREAFGRLEGFRLAFPEVELPPLPDRPEPQDPIEAPEPSKQVSELQRIGANIIRGQLDPNKGGKFERVGLTIEEKQLSIMEQNIALVKEQIEIQRRILNKDNFGRF